MSGPGRSQSVGSTPRTQRPQELSKNQDIRLQDKDFRDVAAKPGASPVLLPSADVQAGITFAGKVGEKPTGTVEERLKLEAERGSKISMVSVAATVAPCKDTEMEVDRTEGVGMAQGGGEAPSSRTMSVAAGVASNLKSAGRAGSPSGQVELETGVVSAVPQKDSGYGLEETHRNLLQDRDPAKLVEDLSEQEMLIRLTMRDLVGTATARIMMDSDRLREQSNDLSIERASVVRVNTELAAVQLDRERAVSEVMELRGQVQRLAELESKSGRDDVMIRQKSETLRLRNTQCESAMKQISDLKGKVRELEKDTVDSDKAFTENRKAKEKAEGELKQANIDCVDLEKQVAEQEKMIERKTQACMEFADMNAKLRAEVESLKRRLISGGDEPMEEGETPAKKPKLEQAAKQAKVEPVAGSSGQQFDLDSLEEVFGEKDDVKITEEQQRARSQVLQHCNAISLEHPQYTFKRKEAYSTVSYVRCPEVIPVFSPDECKLIRVDKKTKLNYLTQKMAGSASEWTEESLKDMVNKNWDEESDE